MSRAAVSYGIDRPLEVVEVSVAPVREHDVRVRFRASGVCHTDLSLMNGGLPVPAPIIPGHEGSGVVEEIGSAVTGVKVGDHVAFTGVISCGGCRPCRDGTPNLCEWGLPTIMGSRQPDGDLRTSDAAGTGLHQWACLGTFAETAIVPELAVIPIPDDVPFEVAALIGCGVLTGVGAVFNRAKVQPGDTVVVFGCGGVGLNVVQAARLVGATTVIAVDSSASKLPLATELGATHAVDAGSEDAVSRIREITGGRGTDFAFEAVGSTSVVRQAWDSVAGNGTVVTIGVPPAGQTVELPADELWSTEKTLMASLYGSGSPREDIALCIELYRQGRLRVEELVTTRYRLDDINEAIADLQTSRNARGVIVY
jgi:S-(hydroxymethyl)glutathione dehydrogenase / alcohol dehydrogenase